MKTAAPEVKAIKETNKRYEAACLAAGKGHSHGPPHTNRIVPFIKALAGAAGILEETKAELTKAAAELEPMTHEEIDYNACQLLTATPCFRSELTRITLHAKDPLRTLLAKAMLQTGAKRTMGTAPAGATEDTLSKYMEALSL